LIKRFGEKLRSLRVARGITLKELAHLMGLTSHGYISELEAGKKIPTVEFLLRAAIFFEVTTDVLIRDEQDLHIASDKKG